MPKDSSKKGNVGSNDPYPTSSKNIDVEAISRAVVESVLSALRGQQGDNPKESSDDDDEEETPLLANNSSTSFSTFSSDASSLEENFNKAIASHQADIVAADGKLKELQKYRERFLEKGNIKGIDETYKMITKHQTKKAEAESAIEIETKHFKALELARAEEAARLDAIRKQKDKGAKGKGKATLLSKEDG
jgi:DNA helicase HerA-like ATPase